ncbi:hypothetical protein [Pseudaminobacter soli (ex Li et al. 2025)]|uniref:Uncharacterized protein n=1 Tax=Pseudaminobacter soli (ex Li et al. 2025) TaxID=1295366 RepID=A0A2P7SE68_9HYPH|nr:hypothetical protein [Mesorhizobium soli]PSJ60778.1 hypothetical protein C7I85_12105 [Mesorhizobium soli]
MTMLWLLSLIVAFGAGWAGSRYRVRKAQAPGAVSRDMSAPWMPFAGIIDAEVIDAAVRGDL